MTNTTLEPSGRRLQRPPDFTGRYIDHFREVLLRHGLPGLLLGCMLLLYPGTRAYFTELVTSTTYPLELYGAGAALLFGFMLAWSWQLDEHFLTRGFSRVGWIFYLLLVSAWEEWVFRAGLPLVLSDGGLGYGPAVIISNLAFGLMHYFTLRWKAHWCLFAFLGGLGLSRQFGIQGDLYVIIGIHWLATFLNTPRPPRGDTL